MCCAWLAENIRPKKSPKSRHLGTIAQLCRAISSQLRHISTIGKNVLNSNVSTTCPHNMVNFGVLAAEICWRVWGTPANCNRFRVLAALLHGTLVVGVSQNVRRWTEGAIYARQSGHHVWHWPTFLVFFWFTVYIIIIIIIIIQHLYSALKSCKGYGGADIVSMSQNCFCLPCRRADPWTGTEDRIKTK